MYPLYNESFVAKPIEAFKELSIHGSTGSLQTRAMFKTSVKRQLSKLVITFSPKLVSSHNIIDYL